MNGTIVHCDRTLTYRTVVGKVVLLISPAETADATNRAEPPLAAVAAANTPLVAHPPSLYVRRLPGTSGGIVEVPDEFDDLIAYLFRVFGAHYTYGEVWKRAAQISLELRDGLLATPALAAAEIVRRLNEPDEGVMESPQEYFVPVTGVGITVSCDLGTAVYLPPQAARDHVRAWRRERGITEGLGSLPPVQDQVGGYLRVDISLATEKRQQELLQERAEDAINVLRFYTRYLVGFDMFYNRPHIGSESPAVYVTSLYPIPEKRASGSLLYHFSLGMAPMNRGQVQAMASFGLTDIVEWCDAPDGNARRAGSLYALEDRIAAAFMALEGWLTRDSTTFKKRNFARRVAVLMRADILPISKMEAQAVELYEFIRSELAHGGELRKRDTEWVDRIGTNIGQMTMLHAIEIIKQHDKAWSQADFWRELDAIAASRPPS
jgi:hypothetical protein